MTKTLSYILLIIFLIACSENKKSNSNAVLAKVNDSYLYEEDIKNLIPAGTSKKDSIIIVKDFMDRWAYQKLLFKTAEKNLSTEKSDELNELIEQYKKDIYTNSYLEQLVYKTLDTIITKEELLKYYESNKEKFRTNDALVKLKYVQINKNNPKINNLTNLFLSNKKEIKNNAIEFKSYALNDSIWIDMAQVYDKLPFVNPTNKEKYLIAGKAVKHSDSLDVFLIKTSNFIAQNQVAPFQYIEPTLRKVILNNRRKELINKFQNEIIQEAKKDKNYEIFKK